MSDSNSKNMSFMIALFIVATIVFAYILIATLTGSFPSSQQEDVEIVEEIEE